MELLIASLAASIQISTFAAPPLLAAAQECDLAYTSFGAEEICIPPAPPDLDCGEITERRFRVYLPSDSDVPEGLTEFDPHGFDGDDDGIGCESG